VESIVPNRHTPRPRQSRSLLCALLSAAGLAASAHADNNPDARMLRYPTVSATQIAFVYANNIWVVPRTGGVAEPVAAPPGASAYPRFSPDGKTIAFVGNYDGNRDIYTIPITGGVPQRITHHPATESLCGWASSDSLLFFMPGAVNMGRQTQLFTVPAGGGLPTKLPVPYGGFGSISVDGQWLAYTPHSIDNRTWKRYRGGMATDIWLINLKDHTSKQITDWEGTDTLPMWGVNNDTKTVYYLSDQGEQHRLNIWSYDTESGKRTQITTFADDDVRWPSIGPGDGKGKGEIVFQLGSCLMLLNLDSGKSICLNITIPGAKPKVKPRTVDAAETITASSISPSGKRVAFVGRGDIFSVPAKEGVTRNLTHSGGIYERDVSWSPDGKWLAYFSDQSGEYELWVRPSDAKAGVTDDKKDDKKDEKKDDKAKNGNGGGGGGDDEKKDDSKDKDDKKDDISADESKPAEPKKPAPIVAPVKLTDLGAGFRYNPTWSPDSKKIAFFDNTGKIMVAILRIDPQTGIPAAEIQTIDKDPEGQTGFSWSHDSAWLAYTRMDEESEHRCIWLTKPGTPGVGVEPQKTRVTNPMFDASTPAFDRKGDYFYYRSTDHFASPRYADIDSTFIYAGSQQLLMVPLREDVKNPLAVKSDEEGLKSDDKSAGGDKPKSEKNGKKPGEPKDDEKKDEPKKDDSKKDDDKKEDSKKDHPPAKGMKKDLAIDLEGFERRATLVPVSSGDFGALEVTDDGKLLYIRHGPRGEDDPANKPGLKIFDPKAFASGDKKDEETVLDNVGSFELSANGKKVLVRMQGGGGAKYRIVDPAAGGGKPQDVSTANMKLTIDPREEWKQIFSDAWREQRDFFYVANMHGVDWPAMRTHYGAMVEDAASREDVQYIIGELISELNIGHAYVQAPGDIGDQGPSVPVGMLACDFSLDNGAYKITHIYEGAPWDADARNPLSSAVDATGKPVKIKPGDYILAVDGTPIDTKQDPYAAFIGLADKPTSITFNDKPTMDGAKEALIKPVGAGGDTAIRYRAWIERNRAYVEAKSEGKVGYVHVPDTGVNGQNELFRQFYGQKGKAAMIIDERWNGGGQLPNRFIELLSRPATSAWALRDVQDWVTPREAHNGPKCMLINGLAGSGGDMFPWLFKHDKVGPVIGMRTWGGLVGISGNPEFIDGGTMTVPRFGFYKLNGTWGVEGHGIDPDIQVLDDPGKMLDGTPPDGPHASVAAGGHGAGDPQLDVAIKTMLDEVAAHPFVKPKRPQSPDRKGMGIPEKDR
jgi:tricorn protease